MSNILMSTTTPATPSKPGIFSVERVVIALHAIFVIVTCVAIFVAAVQGSLPKTWQGSIAFLVPLLTAVGGATAAVIKYLDGAQKSEALRVAAIQGTAKPLNAAARKQVVPPPPEPDPGPNASDLEPGSEQTGASSTYRDRGGQ